MSYFGIIWAPRIIWNFRNLEQKIHIHNTWKCSLTLYFQVYSCLKIFFHIQWENLVHRWSFGCLRIIGSNAKDKLGWEMLIIDGFYVDFYDLVDTLKFWIKSLDTEIHHFFVPFLRQKKPQAQNWDMFLSIQLRFTNAYSIVCGSLLILTQNIFIRSKIK